MQQNQLSKIVTDIFEHDLLLHLQPFLGVNSPDALEPKLREVSLLRKGSKQANFVMLLDAFDTSRLSYLITPMILSALKYKTHFIAPKLDSIEQILGEYFRVDALELKHDHLLEEMDLCFDLKSDLSAKELQIYAVFKALTDPHCKYLLVNGHELDDCHLQLLAESGIEVIYQQSIAQEFDVASIDFKKLFWKRKDVDIAKVCEKITHANTDLLMQITGMQHHDASRLIDDLMYGEHLFEKISVFGEFTETIYKHHLKQA